SIVFVHGLRGDKIETWTKDKVCWPRDLLKDDIENARIITWGYDSMVLNAFKSASQESIFDHAENLLSDLARLRKRVPVQDTRHLELTHPDGRPLIFVGHSLGGLVIKEALIRSYEYHHNAQNARRGQIGQDTKRVIFMGTPHRGSSPAKYAELVANVAKVAFWRHPNTQLVQGLKQDSILLDKNRKSFASISKDLPIGSAFEEKGFLNMGLIVERASAAMDTFNEQVITIPENHMDMCKFSSKDDVGYQRVSDMIDDFASNAVKAQRQGTASRPSADTWEARVEPSAGTVKRAGNVLMIEPADEDDSVAYNSSQRYEGQVEVEEPGGA
ncbi:Alpha/Beta hydrolase protein, partial [Clohesyomyces aquaticus]